MMIFRVICQSLVLGSVTLCLAGCVGQNSVPRTPEEAESRFGGPDVESMEDVWKSGIKSAVEDEEYAKAASLYEQLLSKDPNNKEYFLGYAKMERKAGNADEALDAYETYLKKYPNDVEALEGRGLCMLAKGEFEKASHDLSEVMSRDAARWQSINAIGIIFAMKGRINEAIEYFKSALDVSPDNPTILNNIGLSLAIREKYDLALKSLKLASRKLKHDSRHQRNIDMNLALVYGVMGEMDKAADISRKYIDEAALYNNLGFYAQLANDRELAKTYLNMALTKSPTYYERAWKNLESLESQKKR